MRFDWQWVQIDDVTWILHRDHLPSVGKVVYSAARCTGYSGPHGLPKYDALDEAQAVVKHEVETRPWIPWTDASLSRSAGNQPR